MNYQIEVKHSAEKELKKLPQDIKINILKNIYSLSLIPRPEGCKKLEGSNYYRIRYKNYRVIYSVDDTSRKIFVIKIGHRKDIYRY